MKKTIIAIALTFLLGPGVGHLYLRRFMQGIFLVLGMLFLGISFFIQVARTAPNPEALNKDPVFYMQTYTAEHPKEVFYYDVIVAAFWSYAIVDAYFKSRSGRKGKDEGETGRDDGDDGNT